MPPFHLTPSDSQTVASLLRRVEALEFKLDHSKQPTVVGVVATNNLFYFDNGVYTFSIGVFGDNFFDIRVHADADGTDHTNDLFIDMDGNQDISIRSVNDFTVNAQTGDISMLAGNDMAIGGSNATNIGITNLGFFGTSEVPQQTATTLAQVIAALQAYGLLAP